MTIRDLVLYEIKKRKKAIVVIVAEVILFAMLYFIARQFPQLVVNIVGKVNQSEYLTAFFGIEERIESVTYREIMFTVLMVFMPFILYRNMADTANSMMDEEHMGTAVYLLSRSVSRAKLCLCKLGVGCMLLLAECGMLSLLLWRFSLQGAAHIDILNEIISEQVADAALMLGASALLAFALGFAYSCIVSGRNARSFAINVLSAGYFLSVIPNIFRLCIGIIQTDGVKVLWVEDVMHFVEKLREYNVLYWCNPFVAMGDVLGGMRIGICAGISAVLVIAGIMIYRRRDIGGRG